MNPWRVLLSVFGLALIALGLFASASPGGLVSVGRTFVTPTGLGVLAAIRVTLGAILLLAASRSRLPRVLRVLGVVAIVAGIATPLFGVDRTRAVMDWEVSFGPMAMRMLGLTIIALGAFLIYVVTPARRFA